MRRRDFAPEEGFTLVEMLITTSLLLIVLAIVLPLVAGSLNMFTDTQVRSDAVDNAQLALTQIGHDVVSSNLLYIVTSGTSQVVHVETYGASGTSTCVEYQVLYPATGAQLGALQRRTKTPGTATAWSGSWATVMTGVVNSSEPVVAPATTAPAVFAQTAASQFQSLGVDLWVQLDTRTAPTPAAPENYTSTFTGSAIPAYAAQFVNPSTEPC